MAGDTWIFRTTERWLVRFTKVSKHTRHSSYFQPVAVNILASWWVSLSIQVPANSLGNLSQGYDNIAAAFQYVSLRLGNKFVVFGKKVLVLHLAPYKWPNYRLNFFSCLNVFAPKYHKLFVITKEMCGKPSVLDR